MHGDVEHVPGDFPNQRWLLDAGNHPQFPTHLGLVYGPLVIVFSFVTMWCYSHYRLGRKQHAAILEQLEQRRAARESG